MSRKGTKPTNVRREYRQSFLSGYEHIAQSRDENGNSKAEIVVDGSPKVKRGQAMYQVSVTFLIEQVSSDSGEYLYRVLLNDDPDILAMPVSKRSKKPTGQNAYLPKTGVKGGDSFSLVYGVYQSRQRSLSHTPQHPLQRVTPQIYSFLLGVIDRAIECTILIPENAPRIDDPGQRIESTPTQKSIRDNKKKGRRKKIRAKVLSEALPEEAASVVEIDGQVLGRGQANSEIRSNQLASRTYNGGELADGLSDGQTPDIGF